MFKLKPIEYSIGIIFLEKEDADEATISFTPFENHFLVSMYGGAIETFSSDIDKCGYLRKNKEFEITWAQDIDFDLLTKIINFEIKENKNRGLKFKGIPLKIDFSHNSYGYGATTKAISIEYNANLNVYVGDFVDGMYSSLKVNIAVDDLMKIINKYDVKNWKFDYYSFAGLYTEVLDGDWWNLKINFDGNKLISKGSSDFCPKKFNRFEKDMMKLMFESQFSNIKNNA